MTVHGRLAAPWPTPVLATAGRRLARSSAARRLAGAGVLGIVVWRVGVDPSLRAVGNIDGRALVAALGLSALTTLCCAWRWSLVATGIGARVPLRTALAACYRSQFLNTATPGGVIGDVHRGVRHGQHTGDAARGLRSVVWERTAGQVVQAVMALVVLTVLPSPLRREVAWLWAVVGVVLVSGALWWAGPAGQRPGWPCCNEASAHRGPWSRRSGCPRSRTGRGPSPPTPEPPP